jgi:hypothetical protein
MRISKTSTAVYFNNPSTDLNKTLVAREFLLNIGTLSGDEGNLFALYIN